MTRAGKQRTIDADVSVPKGSMTTSLADDAKHDDWAEPRAISGGDPVLAPVQWLPWTLVSLALLSAFLIFVIDDYPLRSLIAVQ